MKAPLTILHLEDNEVDADFMATMLQEEGMDCEILRAISREDYLKLVRTRRFDVIISDYSMPSFDGGEALRLARDLAPETPFIYVSGTIGEEVAVESLKNGAVDYVLKSRLSRFPAAVKRAVHEAKQRAERMAFQRELLRRDELFRQITDNVDDLIAVLDVDGRRVFSSASYSEVLADPAELEGTDSFADIHPDDRERIRAVFAHTVATGQGQRVEYRLQRRDGAVRTIESQGTVIRDAAGRIANVLVVSRDVTEARRVEAQLREQAALLDRAQDAIFVRDLDQKVTYWNKGAERLYGWSREEVSGRRASELLYREGGPRRDDIWATVLSEGGWTGELRQVTKSGRDLIVISRRTLLRNQAGEPVAVMNINTDVTERKEMEEKLLRSQRLETIGALAGGIAHDLNNVLSPVLMVADLLRDEATNESDRRMLETVKTSAMRGSEMVKQILSFAHGASGEPMVLQLRHLIKDMLKLMGDTFPRSIRLEHDLAANLMPVCGDPTQLHQVLLNLCVNARDAMPEGGRLAITARNIDAANGPHVLVEVTDTGSGIPPEIREKIFEPFFTTKGVGKGTGLGLSTVAGIVKRHQGRLELTSAPGRGTTFQVRLPACIDKPVAEAKRETPAPAKGNGEHILLVDDEQAILLMTKGTLEAFNYRVTVARDGLEALSLYRQATDRFDLVITDSMMPEMDGPTLTRYLHRLDPKVRVVAISGLAEVGAFSGLDGGPVVAALRKPYEGSHLLMILGNIFAKAAPPVTT
ncbi:MAG TPA: PAS domain S-box protein [Verrucomicrobiae bacterium]|nr:PAS domain S-box protein [Verrucomicrobiae bacterium]